ncbi:hypothetical protein [Streptomyces sp. NBC_01334]|nr:hypothetical protein OG736_01920 [Streptomyces sp. NBC_01334]
MLREVSIAAEKEKDHGQHLAAVQASNTDIRGGPGVHVTVKSSQCRP